MQIAACHLDGVAAPVAIEIDEIKNTGLSIMPEGFEGALDVQAIADLLSYLIQQ